jgi:hypothetical protein
MDISETKQLSLSAHEPQLVYVWLRTVKNEGLLTRSTQYLLRNINTSILGISLTLHT